MNKGFIALISVVSVAGILLALVYSSSIETGTFFDQAMRKEYRVMNYYYAYDCLDQAILGLAEDNFFSPTEPLEITRYHCYILSIEKPLGQENIRVISSKGSYMNADVYRKATVKLHEHNLEIISIE